MRKAFGFAGTLALLASLVLITGGVQAGSPIGSIFLIYDDTNFVSEAHPSVAYNSQDHEYLVVWEAAYLDPGNPFASPLYYEIWGRRVSGSGAPLGSAFRISPAHQGSSPDVAYSSAANEYLVVWAHDVGIWGQRVSASGALEGSVIGIAGGASGFSTCDQPAVAYGSVADRYLVTFRYTLIGAGSTGIWVNSIHSNGNPDGSSVEVHAHSTTLLPEEPDVAYNRSRNEFLVVCQQTLGASNRDIYGRRVEMSSGATPMGTAFSITNLSHDETVPAVAAVPTVPTAGQYLVTWQTHESFLADIQARTVSGSEALGTVHDLAATGWGEYRPAVAGCESTYQFLAVWTWVPVPGTNAVMEVQGRTLALDGAPLHATTYVGGVQVFDAAVAAGQACGHLVAFDDNATPGDTTRGIYGRLWGNLVYLPLVMR
jgi:hypothetical protein